MYSYDTRVRYSEVDADERLTWLALIDYFQNCTTEQSEMLGIGIDFLKKQHMAWVILTWQICVNRLPKLAEKVKVETRPYELKGFYGKRNFFLYSEEGELLAYADSIWVLMNMQTMHPARIPQALYDAYELSEKYPMSYFGRKLKAPETAELLDEMTVPQFFIDTNHHMNNSKYILVAQNYLPEDFQVREMRVEYRTQAVLGDTLQSRVAANQDEISVCLTKEDGMPYAIVKFFSQLQTDPKRK